MRKTTLLGLGAMLLIIISLFLPILSVGGMSMGLSDGIPRGKEIMYFLIVLAALMGIFAFLANKKHLASIGTFIFAGILAAISLKWFNDASTLGASFGTGLILYVVGSLLGVISAVLGFMKK